jgi:NOL1/NOP2/fmu family ribosome biogenesis protein
MNNLKILNKTEKEEIAKKLEEQFGIKEIKGIIIQKGKERMFLFQGAGQDSVNLIKKIDSIVEIERAGVYIGKIFQPTGELRLSLEGTQVFKNKITKNIFELSSPAEYETWMNGQELQIKTGLRGMIVIKYKEEFLGCGKASEEKIGNFIPKNRRLKLK